MPVRARSIQIPKGSVPKTDAASCPETVTINLADATQDVDSDAASCPERVAINLADATQDADSDAASCPETVEISRERLRKFIKTLTARDRIVHVCCDEVFTNQKTVYSRAEDCLHGCSYADEQYSRTSLHLPQIERTRNEIFELAEDIGLDVRAFVCDRGRASAQTSKRFRKGVYNRKGRDGSMYKIRLLFDYSHIVNAFSSKIALNKLPMEADVKNLMSALVKTRYAKSRFWALRVAIPVRNAPFGSGTEELFYELKL
uniref:Uncharacterized protein n=1 Tax=Glossina palpalis gambiensis TaxID=67801 RepID=A0A1B0BUB7_9MUSC